MMDNGASGYLLKNATQEEIMEGLHAVIKGRIYLSGEAADALRRNSNDSIPVVTSREKEVLELIAEGWTNNEIATKLFVSANTVDTHRKSLLNKFSAKNTASLVKMAAQMGLI